MSALLLIVSIPALTRADTIESVSGTVIEGKIVSRDDRFVVIEIQVAGKAVQRRYSLSMVRAITVDGKREVLRESAGAAARSPATGGAAPRRSRQEVRKLIEDAGRTPPDWLASVKLSLPPSLDLAWPDKADGPWDNQKNVGQYVWDIINPNPGRWREGVKLMLHLKERHAGNEEVALRAAAELGGMYHRFFQDYARAAYWWEQAGDRVDEVWVAECYWKLGNKAMAAEILEDQEYVPAEAIKLWAEMGELDKALKLVPLFERGNWVDWAYINAGDACRNAGRSAQALTYYQKLLALPETDRNRRNRARAQISVDTIRLYDSLDLRKVPDGTYASSSLGYEGPVGVEVRVQGGRIESVKITQHREKQFYSAIQHTTGQIIRKQSVKGIDATSRATITSEAITHATAKALHGAMK